MTDNQVDRPDLTELLQGTFLVLAISEEEIKIDRCSSKSLAEMPLYKSKWQ